MTQNELSIYSLVLKVEDKRISQMKSSELLQITDRLKKIEKKLLVI